MKRHLSYILVFVLITSCVREENKPTVISEVEVMNQLIDTSTSIFLPYDTLNKSIFPKSNPVILNSEDINNIELLLSDCLESYNKTEPYKKVEIWNDLYIEQQLKASDFMIDKKNYIRQYIAVKNNLGEKEVWVNCFCKSDTVYFRNIWKKEIIEVRDGGNCFFNLKVNLTKNKYYELSINPTG